MKRMHSGSRRKEDGHSEEGLKNLTRLGTAGKGWAPAMNSVVVTGYCGPAHMTVKRTVKIRKTELKVETDQSVQTTIWSRATVLIDEMAHLARSQAFPQDRPPGLHGISLC